MPAMAWSYPPAIAGKTTYCFSSVVCLVLLVVDLLNSPFGSVVVLDLVTDFLLPSASMLISVEVLRSRVVPSESV